MGRKHRRRAQHGSATAHPPPVTAAVLPQPPQPTPAPAPTRWRDPALVVSLLSAVVAMIAAFYAYKQASVGREQLAHEELIAQHRALAVAVRVVGNIESALGRCLHDAVHVEDCGTTLRDLEPDVLQAANDPEVATYYPLIHMGMESLYFTVRTEQIEETLKTIRSVEPDIDREIRALDRFDAIPGMWLTHGVSRVEEDVMIVKRFEPPWDGGPDAPDAQ